MLHGAWLYGVGGCIVTVGGDNGFRGKEGHWLRAGGGGGVEGLIKGNRKTGLGGWGGDNDLIKRKRKAQTGYAKSRHYLGEGGNKQKTVTWCVAVRCTQNVRRYASSFTWYQPCNNQQRCNHCGGYSEMAV